MFWERRCAGSAVLPVIAALPLLLTACPNDDVADGMGGSGTGGSDTGGDGDGDTGEVGGTVPLNTIPPVPQSIGNGLVYDSRPMATADGVASVPQTPENWSSGHLIGGTLPGSRYSNLKDAGFRMVQPTIRNAVSNHAGPGWTFGFEDDSTYIADDDNNFRTELSINLADAELAQSFFDNFEVRHMLVAQGMRPLSVQLFSVSGTAASWGEAYTWVLDGNPASWKVDGLRNRGAMAQQIITEAQLGFRPLSVSSRARAGGTGEYAAIFIADNIDAESVVADLGIRRAALADVQTNINNGLIPYSLASRDGTATFDILYAPQAQGHVVNYAFDLGPVAFRNQDSTARQGGQHLVTATSYDDGNGGTLWAGVWQRYTRGVSATRTQNPVTDPSIAAIETAVIAYMNNPPTATARPACTFAALTGNNVDYKAAYTNAPAIWPNTALDSVFGHGSLAKSFTAAVLLQVLDDHGYSVDDSFVEVMGWDPGLFTDGTQGKDQNYQGFETVTIREMLQHRSGLIPASTVSAFGPYYFHSTMRSQLVDIGAPAELTEYPLPLMGYARWVRAIMEGDIDPSDLPNSSPTIERPLWNPMFQGVAQAPMAYSNETFSLLGAVIEHLTGISYEQYVRNTLLAANAGQSHRALNDTRLPRDGMYQPIRPQEDWQLRNAKHPYNTVNQWNPQPVPPLFTDANLQTQTGVLMDGTTPTWNDWRDIWEPNVSGRSPSQVPSTVGYASYSGQYAMPGAPLPAGGWEASSVDLAQAVRSLLAVNAETPAIDPALAPQLWQPNSPAIQNPCTFCDYGLGWYIYNNWVLAQGAIDGSMGVAVHNLVYDVTFAVQCDVVGNPTSSLFTQPLLTTLEAQYP
jgi:CubicO group peptidase (beta-lactamase class C family)